MHCFKMEHGKRDDVHGGANEIFDEFQTARSCLTMSLALNGTSFDCLVYKREYERVFRRFSGNDVVLRENFRDNLACILAKLLIHNGC